MSGHSLSVRFAMLGGLGKSPFASGTVATIVAGVPFAYLFGSIPSGLALLLLLLLFLLGCYVSGQAEKELGRHDAKEIVIDELIGYLVHHDWTAHVTEIVSPGGGGFSVVRYLETRTHPHSGLEGTGRPGSGSRRRWSGRLCAHTGLGHPADLGVRLRNRRDTRPGCGKSEVSSKDGSQSPVDSRKILRSKKASIPRKFRRRPAPNQTHWQIVPE